MYSILFCLNTWARLTFIEAVEDSRLKSMLFYLNLKFLFSLKSLFFGLITCHNIIVVFHAWLEIQFFVHTRNTNRRINRSSHQRCSIKRGVLKNFAAFTGTPVPLLFLIKLQALRLQAVRLQLYLKRDSGTGVFLWIFKIFKNTFFTEHLRTTVSV